MITHEPLALVHHNMGLYQGTIMNVKCLLETGGGGGGGGTKTWEKSMSMAL